MPFCQDISQTTKHKDKILAPFCLIFQCHVAENQWEHEKTFVAYEETKPPNTATVLLVSAFVFLFRQNCWSVPLYSYLDKTTPVLSKFKM